METLTEITFLIIDLKGATVPGDSPGDLTAKEILQRHMALVSSPVEAYGGTLIDPMDASVTAHFTDPKKAVKAAVEIREAVERLNNKKKQEEQIHITIGIQFENGHIEPDAIWDDGVDQTLRIMDVAASGQICISRAVYERVMGLPEVAFRPLIHMEAEDDREGFQVYELLKKQTAPSETETFTRLYLKPAWDPGVEGFEESWNSLTEAKRKLWEERVTQEKTLSDRSVVLCLKDVSSALLVANNVLASLNRRREGGPLNASPPLQVVIDSGPFPEEDSPAAAGPDVSWEDIDPGEIYVSSTTCEGVASLASFSLEPAITGNGSKSFYRLVPYQEDEEGKTLLFSHQHALIRGSRPPCYYCGDRRHAASGCPSKKLLGLSHGLEKAGHLSLGRLEALFQEYLKASDPEHAPDPKDHHVIVRNAFYDLKQVYQLRFFRTIWGWDDPSWEILMTRQSGRHRTGPLWQALDALRASNLPKAKKILEKAPVKVHRDYRSPCVLGFLEMEKDNFRESARYFNEASEKAKTIPQKIFTLFQLFRLFDLNHKTILAENKIKEILWLYHQCPEALYQDAVLKFRKGKIRDGLTQLLGLIKEQKEFYVRALIDPDLAPFAEAIQPHLKKLLDRARKSGETSVERAEAEGERLKGLIGEETEEYQKAQTLIKKIKGLSESESYAGYLEAEQIAANDIFSMGQRIIQERRARVFKGLREIDDRCRKQLRFAKDFSYNIFVQKTCNQLLNIQTEAQQLWKEAGADTSDGYRQVLEQIKAFLEELNETRNRMEKMYNTSQFFRFLFLLLKYNLIFQAINLSFVLVMIPLLGHYAASFAVPGHAFLVQNTGAFQKWGFIMGGLFWILVSFVTAIKKMHSRKRSPA
ncbi:MAG: hypothetical protein JRL30_06295 [Deltaproteobacteria bacterium]|nr:hypothetical protein [Deltaproteobacteria bacterium]